MSSLVSGNLHELSSVMFQQMNPSLCKLHFSVNDSEWSEGVDIPIHQIKKAPLNLAVCLPP